MSRVQIQFISVLNCTNTIVIEAVQYRNMGFTDFFVFRSRSFKHFMPVSNFFFFLQDQGLI